MRQIYCSRSSHVEPILIAARKSAGIWIPKLRGDILVLRLVFYAVRQLVLDE